ncbi:hypothetical protein [Leptospira santarosai]|uniref:Uncharacterized protein n=1 Tax=Leptospira noguchii serovar Panama str. CZ214 TaxID=1001595 RepID=T0GRX7_9LEPT|nr:hypothetical protein [Leptospira santarosai]EMP02329.1 hypothetical protein LEP1GSC171_0250 [Leptospira santarosai str. HAI1380]EQA71652.1 hypothetical protein LEP1GSC059_1113 [Leptospira noguchii serovar Panama str. CZ214]
MKSQEREIQELKYKISLIKEIFHLIFPKVESYLSSKDRELIKAALIKIGE